MADKSTPGRDKKKHKSDTISSPKGTPQSTPGSETKLPLNPNANPPKSPSAEDALF